MVKPLRCVSCGLSISHKVHVTEQGNVCDRCWNDPNLFFPEKMSTIAQMTYIDDLFSSKDEIEYLELPVIKINQKGITLFSGKLKAKDLLKLYAIFGFEEGSLEGYQREMYEEQINEISEYIINCPTALMPGLVISIRDGVSFSSIDSLSDFSDFGLLNIPIRKGALWIIDGQHRIGGFEKLLTTLGNIFEDEASYPLKKVLNYELPVTFIDTKNAVLDLNKTENLNLSPIDIERVAFFIINKTQRRLSPSLKDTLQYCISRVGLKGIPAIEKESWRTEAVAIGIDMNSDLDSPFYKKINISGQRGLKRPLQLNSFVSSLRPLFKNNAFIELKTEEKRLFLFNYWNEMKNINNSAFSKNSYTNYLLLKTIGFYTLNLMAVDYINLSRKNNTNFVDINNIRFFIKKFNGFEWTKNNSILAAYGGMKGVREAREILLEYISKRIVNT